ncbi:WhiB family transcriptional regulator [Nocardia tengchongensis]|uniref:WhiB family transcriptional regulator n=1 Tax=Nocardia tengchongensis TaxID=2055889 RepID=UPI0036067D34
MRLDSVSDHPDLWTAAVCADPAIDPDLFFPDRWDDAREAQIVCGDCPLLAQCASRALQTEVYAGVVASVPMPPLYAGKRVREAARKELRRIAAGGAPLLQDEPVSTVWRDPEFQIRVYELRVEVGFSWPRVAEQLGVGTDTARRALHAYSGGREGLVA